MKRSTTFVICTLIIFIIELTSCNSNNNIENIQAQSYDYILSYIEIPDDHKIDSLSSVFFDSGTNNAYVIAKKAGGYVKACISEDYDSFQTEEIPLDNYSALKGSAVFDDNGNFIHIEYTQDNNGYVKDMYAVATDKSGYTIFSCLIEDTDIIRYIVCYNDEYFLASSNQITVISNTGEKMYEIKSNDMVRGLALSGDKIVVYIIGVANGIRYIDTQNKCIGSRIDILKDSILSNGSLYNGDGDNFYITNTVGLYRVNVSSEQAIIEEIVQWYKIGLYADVCSLAVLSSEEIFISAAENSNYVDIKLIKLTRKSEAVEKTELKMVSFQLSGEALKAVAMFNRENENININIESVTTVTFNNLIASGDIPDIVEMYFYQNATAINNYVKKGLFADMYEILDDSATDDYLDCLKEPFEYNEELPYIITSFSFKTLVGKIKNINTDSWTTDEFIEICKNLPDNMSFSNNSTMVNAFDAFSIKELVDYSEGVSHFDRPQFKDMLEISKIDANKQLDSYTEAADKYNNQREDEVLVEYVRIRDFSEIKKTEYRFATKDIVYIGYPSSTGSYPIIEPDNSYAIMKDSKNTGDAAKFIEYILMTENGREYYDYSFPVTRSLMDELIQKHVERSYYYIDFLNDGSISFVDDEDIEEAKREHGETMVSTYTQSDIDLVMSFMDKAKGSIELDETLNSIIYEEESGYLYGEQSLENTVKLIKSRVDIYINEQK